MTGKQEGPYKGEETKAEEDKVWQYVCVCVCVRACVRACGHVYVVYEDTNLYNDMGMT